MAKKETSKRIELKDSGVIFDEAAHTYTLNDIELSGITGMLTRQLYPEEYKDVDPDVLNKAAEYGTGVHHAIEAYDVNWDIDDEHETEILDYVGICREFEMKHEATEYCVTDGKNWASNIDKVYRVDDDTFDLGDIKTYGEMSSDKKDKARWQLSIYAYLFEAQNKKAHVRNLYILHIRNKVSRSGSVSRIAERIQVKRIDPAICKELLDCDVAGSQFSNPFGIPTEYAMMEDRIRELTQSKKDIDDELAAIKARILMDMESKDVKTWATDTMRLTRKMPSVREGFDIKSFRADHPEIDYVPYETETQVAGSLTITL